MKLTSFLWIAGIMQIYATGFTQQQRVTLKLQNAPIENLFREIESQTDIRFLYRNEHVDDQLASIDVSNETVAQVLDQVLLANQMNYKLLEGNLIVVTDIKSQQNIEITGKVSSSSGEPLPGVNVVIKGTNTGTVTNLDGNFSIKVPDQDAILVISFIGYLTEEIIVGNQTNITVTLVEDIAKLDEVVVIGYGTMKRSDLTGAVVSVTGDELNRDKVTSFEQALQGKAAGVQVFQNSGQPGGSISVRIRGFNSVFGSNEPLYVIDGVPISSQPDKNEGYDFFGTENEITAMNPLSTLNPADIESIDVLKDASAAAIYGARAANGVIMITTKQGKAGESRISYDFSYGWQQPSKYIDMMNLKEYAQFQNELADENIANKRPEFGNIDLLGEGTNWQEEVFRTAPMKNHQLSFSGGTEKTVYSIGLGYVDQEGIVIGSGFDRLSIRLNAASEVKSWLKVGNNITLSRTNDDIVFNNSVEGVLSQALFSTPDIPVRFPDGTFAGAPENEFAPENPVAKATSEVIKMARTRLLGNIYAELTLLKDLQYRIEVGYDIQNNNRYYFLPTYEWGARINEKSEATRGSASTLYWILKNYVTYSKEIQQHNVSLMVGYEAQESNWEGISGSRANFLTNDIYELNAGDALTAQNGSYKGSNSLTSGFGRLNYNYADRYLLTASYRIDGSSNFGPANKYGHFKSFSIGWRIDKEAFMSNIDQISNLKLRAGYGETGNQDIPGYAYGTPMMPVTTEYGTGFVTSRHPNPEVQWEASKSTNIGLDISLFSNRIDFIFEYYNKRSDNLLLQPPLPHYLGGGSWMGIGEPIKNVGELENKGIELTLSSVNISKRNFMWSSSLNYTRNRNKILSLGEENLLIIEQAQWFEDVTKTEAGQPIGQFYGYEVVGVYDNLEEIQNSGIKYDKIDRNSGIYPGDLQFANNHPDSVIDQLDRTYIGNPHPDFTFGFNNNFTYRNFDLSINIQGVYGNEIYNFSRSQTEGLNQTYINQTVEVQNRAKLVRIDEEGLWTDPANVVVSNPGTDIPRFVSTDPNDNNRVSDRFVEDGSYLRIKNITFGYTLPAVLTQKVQIQKLRIFGSIQNAYTFTNYSGFDPEIGMINNNVLLNGVDNGRYPLARIYTLGLNLLF